MLPNELYVFVGDNLLANHNIAFTGQIMSASATLTSAPEGRQPSEPDWLPLLENPNKAPTLSLFSLRLLGRYYNEMNGELIRRQHYLNCPSRFGCLFAFGDEDSCERASKLYNWNFAEVRKFRPRTILRWSRHNMSIVSIMNHTAAKLLGPVDVQLWNAYWSGQARAALDIPSTSVAGQRETLTATPPLWEYLIDGVLEVIDERRPTPT